MIRTLKLTNFQAWPSVELPLSPITVIIGETNAGKSSLLRGLACVLFNAFEGQGMVRQGATTAEVELTLEEGRVIRWSRGQNVNRYQLDDLVLDKPGRAVPSAIQQALQIHELEFDGEVVRLQWAPQMDAPFLLADSGAKATRMLGVAGNAAVVAQAARLAQQETKSQADAFRAATAQLEQLTTQLSTYADVEVAAPIAQDLRAAMAAHAAAVTRRQTLEELATLQAALAPQRQALELRHRQASTLTTSLQQWIALDQRQTVLAGGIGLTTKRQGAATKAGQAQQLVAAWEQVRRLEELRGLFTAALDHQARHADLQARLTDATAQLDLARTEHTALVTSMTCPTCGRVKEAA